MKSGDIIEFDLSESSKSKAENKFFARMLKHAKAGSFLEHPPVDLHARALADDQTVKQEILLGRTISHYQIIEKLGRERRRDGAYAWGVFEDAAEEGRMLETFLVESWLEHLRQNERVTEADRVVQDLVNRFHIQGTPKVTHLIASEETAEEPSASSRPV